VIVSSDLNLYGKISGYRNVAITFVELLFAISFIFNAANWMSKNGADDTEDSQYLIYKMFN